MGGALARGVSTGSAEERRFTAPDPSTAMAAFARKLKSRRTINPREYGLRCEGSSCGGGGDGDDGDLGVVEEELVGVAVVEEVPRSTAGETHCVCRLRCDGNEGGKRPAVAVVVDLVPR